MYACNNCGEPLYHPNTGHTVICPSCGFMFDFKSPGRSPDLSTKDLDQLPPAPLKQRARWMAIMAMIVLVSVYYYRYTNPPEEQAMQEQTTQEQIP